MGSWVSRQWEEMRESTSTPPAHLQKRNRILEQDPRSPTTEITRTPIEVEGTPKRLGSSGEESENTQGEFSFNAESPTISLIQKPKVSQSEKENLQKKIFERRNPLAQKNSQKPVRLINEEFSPQEGKNKQQ